MIATISKAVSFTISYLYLEKCRSNLGLELSDMRLRVDTVVLFWKNDGHAEENLEAIDWGNMLGA